ncbi:MAG: GIY-YIG nuclease family protein [Candidatus Peribacteria bacterium]|nr:GIY-YIG nuclease family protein [Candidatus Peribacteria bacterium]
MLLLNNGQYYVGSTDNMERRFAQHSSGKVIATK